MRNWTRSHAIGGLMLAVLAAGACAPGVPSPPDSPRFHPDSVPRFEDHPAQAPPLAGDPAEPDFRTLPGARVYRTAIRRGAAEGPNMARRFTVVAWGCGTMCRQFVIVDAESGRITDGFTTMFGVDHRLESELLVVNPRPSDLPEDAYPMQREQYYRWTGERLELLGVVR